MSDELSIERGKIILKHKRMKQLVWDILSQDARARNDDKWLILRVLQDSGQNIVLGKDGFVWQGDYNDFGTIPNFETIRRVRQEIQNDDGQWLPTDPEVLYKRRIKEETIRTYYSGNEKIVNEWVGLAYKVN